MSRPSSDRKSTRLNSSHVAISYAVFCSAWPRPGSTLFPYTTLFRSVVRGTREAASLTLGASPRAGVSLLKAARAAALLDGRDYVIPDDVKGLAPAVLRHRVNVAPELELEGVTPDAALKAILDKTEVPTT